MPGFVSIHPFSLIPCQGAVHLLATSTGAIARGRLPARVSAPVAPEAGRGAS